MENSQSDDSVDEPSPAEVPEVSEETKENEITEITIPEKDNMVLKIGDCVKVDNPGFQPRFGEIKSFGKDDDPNLKNRFWFTSFIKIEEAQGGIRKKHQPDNEIVFVQELEKEDIKNIIEKVSILPLNEYVEKHHKEARLKGHKRIKVPKNVYFYRQKYEADKKKFTPELKPYCTCRKFVNPNETLLECPKKCGNFYHPSCLLMAPVKRCVTCGAEIPIELIIGKKREVKADLKLEQSLLKAASISKKGKKGKESISPYKRPKYEDSDDSKSSEPASKNMFKTLSTEKAENLASYISTKKEEFNVSHNLTPSQIRRK
jgi:hypothetical protein